MHFNTYKSYSLEAETGKYLFKFEALGTNWEIESGVPLSFSLQQHILEQVDRFKRTYSRFHSDSLVSQMAAVTEGWNVFCTESDVFLNMRIDWSRNVSFGKIRGFDHKQRKHPKLKGCFLCL